MHFHKYPYHPNFEFVGRVRKTGAFRTARGPGTFFLGSDGAGVHHVRVQAAGWEQNDSDAGLPELPRVESRNRTGLQLTADGTLEWRSADGERLLSSPRGRFFGQCGPASCFEFIREPDDLFYGLGEKWTGLEHSGRRTKFWNTDVWADYHPQAYLDGKPPPDPAYLSIPYLIVRRRARYVGLLLDNPHATFVSTAAQIVIGNQMELRDERRDCFHLGAEQGQPNLYLIEGPAVREVTRRLQRLVGTTPRPPLWALGAHQCRWGYRSAKDLLRLDREYRRHRFPVDGLWLDIDYMDNFKVFTWARQHFDDPSRVFAKLEADGRHVVPVIDPGVKREPGYRVYDEGRAARAFCLNPQGQEFVGLVWPGDSVFPDFSREDARAWWATEVAAFAGLGIKGVWIDMNDPSTGPVENNEMLFDHGRRSHSTYHNQYALGMSAATHAGLRQAHPDERPFVLSRSGFIGSQRYAAIWTGDNASNYHHLKACISTTLNLALSGIPFNAPDVGGFGGDTNAQLLQDWYKACFLFPFFRNHSCAGTRDQEPWAFDGETLSVTRHYVRLRYKLLPYLYHLFADHEARGEAILRPLFYDFADTRKQELGLVDDAFLVGPAILQAPIVTEKQRRRDVILPAGPAWWDATNGRWHEGGATRRASGARTLTPLYIREGSLVPMQVGERETQHNNFRDLELHCWLRNRPGARGIGAVTADDGRSFRYQQGEQTRLRFEAAARRGALHVHVIPVATGFGPIRLRLIIYERFEEVVLHSTSGSTVLPLTPHAWIFTGSRLRAWQSPAALIAAGELKV